MKGSGVTLPKVIVTDIVRAWKKDPNEMTRKLMRNLISVDKLKTMTPCGGNKDLDQIPSNIFTAVEREFIFKWIYSRF